MTPGPAAVPPTAPQKKSGMSGCVIALLVFGGVLVLLCLVGGVAFWRVSQSEEGKKVFTAIGKGVQMAEKGLNAPGAAELREAGCPQAIVLETDDIMGVVEVFIDGGPRDKLEQQTMVLCQGQLFDDLPSCEVVASTYLSAVHPAKRFTVSVRRQGNNKPICERRYSSDGTPE